MATTKKSKSAKTKVKIKKPEAAAATEALKKKKAEKQSEPPKEFGIGKASNGKGASSVKELKGASYNPRFITDKELNHLDKSIDLYGDLSGVVFNVATQTLVSGHQRVKIIKTKDNKIVKNKMKRDRQGTVAVGHIEVKENDGTVTKIPYREVDWTDKMVEMAANVAANMAGGNFDQVKLGAVLHKLEQGRFDVEMTGTDNWDLQKAIGKFKKSKDGSDQERLKGQNFGKLDGDDGEEFESFNPDDMEFNACCPKCKFKFNVDLKASAAPAKKMKPEPKSATVGKAKKTVKKVKKAKR